MSAAFSENTLYFLLYAIAGWVCEVIFCSIPEKRFVNRGFLKGPYCPIYGFGAIIMLYICVPIGGNPVLVFLAAFLAATVLEYFTSWFMEALYGIRWWDYSHIRFNINGRICLSHALMFGALGLGLVYGLHPVMARAIGDMSNNTTLVLSSVGLAVLFLDLLMTLNEMQSFIELLRSATRKISERRVEMSPILPEMRISSRFTQAFPNLRPKELTVSLEELRGYWERRVEELKGSRASRAGRSFTDGLSGIASGVKTEIAVCKSELSIHKLFWVFLTGSVLGYAVETVYCLAKRGVIESRQGLLYGPFSQVYGLGAVLFVLLLTPFAKRKDSWLFFGSAIIGGAFEFLCSLVQEAVFGSVSWEYSDRALSIGGRTNLTYMLFWGALGLFFMRGFYPRLSQIIDRMSKRQGVFFTGALAVLLTVDICLSAAAVYRWAERVGGGELSNGFEVFLDEHYGDERMEEVYPNMMMVN